MGKQIDSVYLSGWEYNRLLQEDPLTPRVSALPAQFLWSGSHQLWMFRHVYVTRDSLDNERAAAERLGWASGAIFDRMVENGVVRPVDWQHLDASVAEQLRATHANLRREFEDPEQGIRSALRNGDEQMIQDVKNRLLQPVLTHFGCLASGAPDSLSNWITAPEAEPSADGGTSERVAQSLSALAAPVVSGLDLCRPPGTGVSPADMQRQKHVEATVERPMIPELLAGDGPFSGPEGYGPYQAELERYRDVYAPVNRQLMDDWKRHETKLFKLRDAAEKHLWPSLHNEWIPELLDDPASAHRFARNIRRGLRISSIAGLLDSSPTRLIIGGLAATAAWKGMELVPGADQGTEALIQVFLAGSAATNMADRVRAPGSATVRLGVFYQQTKRITARL